MAKSVKTVYERYGRSNFITSCRCYPNLFENISNALLWALSKADHHPSALLPYCCAFPRSGLHYLNTKTLPSDGQFHYFSATAFRKAFFLPRKTITESVSGRLKVSQPAFMLFCRFLVLRKTSTNLRLTEAEKINRITVNLIFFSILY